MKWIYTPIRETLWTEDFGMYCSVGIWVEEKSWGSIKKVALVSDVSTDWVSVCRLSELCTAGQLSPGHLPDLIEDFLVMGDIWQEE